MESWGLRKAINSISLLGVVVHSGDMFLSSRLSNQQGLKLVENLTFSVMLRHKKELATGGF